MVAAMASEGARLGVWTHSFLSFVIPHGSTVALGLSVPSIPASAPRPPPHLLSPSAQDLPPSAQDPETMLSHAICSPNRG